MEVATIKRQYDEVIAKHYDFDPQSVTRRSLEIAFSQLKDSGVLSTTRSDALKMLDLGMGTGMFIRMVLDGSERSIEPHGIDLSARMLEQARKKIPSLKACVDDAANFDTQFEDEPFDLVCTHFITGFVAFNHLAPRIFRRLKPGGYWSFIGGTSEGYRGLQKKAGHPLIQLMFGRHKLDLSSLLVPANVREVAEGMDRHGLTVLEKQTFEPELKFRNFSEFMDFAYTGGWLTPFVEKIGLQKSKKPLQKLLNRFVFPVDDNHSIAIVLAQKPFDTAVN